MWLAKPATFLAQKALKNASSRCGYVMAMQNVLMAAMNPLHYVVNECYTGIPISSTTYKHEWLIHRSLWIRESVQWRNMQSIWDLWLLAHRALNWLDIRDLDLWGKLVPVFAWNSSMHICHESGWLWWQLRWQEWPTWMQSEESWLPWQEWQFHHKYEKFN